MKDKTKANKKSLKHKNNFEGKYIKEKKTVEKKSLFTSIIIPIASLIVAIISTIFTISISNQSLELSKTISPSIYDIECTHIQTDFFKKNIPNDIVVENNTDILINQKKGSISDIGNIIMCKDESTSKYLVYRIESIRNMTYDNEEVMNNYIKDYASLYKPKNWNYIEEQNILYSILYVKNGNGQIDLWLIILNTENTDKSYYKIYNYTALTLENQNSDLKEAFIAYKYARDFIFENNI